jgi:glycosyltransferase involved in cell wall biosynthesis
VKLADMLAVGVPVVAEAVGQVTEYVVNGRTGTTFPTGNIDGVINELIDLLQNPARQAKLAAGARMHIAEHFSWAHLAKRLHSAYEK